MNLTKDPDLEYTKNFYKSIRKRQTINRKMGENMNCTSQKDISKGS